jgi:hypothetical protein
MANQIENELSSQLPVTTWQVAVICTMCDERAIVLDTDDESAARALAVEGDRMVMEDDGTAHNYQTAVIEVEHKLVFVPNNSKE